MGDSEPDPELEPYRNRDFDALITNIRETRSSKLHEIVSPAELELLKKYEADLNERGHYRIRLPELQIIPVTYEYEDSTLIELNPMGIPRDEVEDYYESIDKIEKLEAKLEEFKNKDLSESTSEEIFAHGEAYIAMKKEFLAEQKKEVDK